MPMPAIKTATAADEASAVAVVTLGPHAAPTTGDAMQSTRSHTVDSLSSPSTPGSLRRSPPPEERRP